MKYILEREEFLMEDNIDNEFKAFDKFVHRLFLKKKLIPSIKDVLTTTSSEGKILLKNLNLDNYNIELRPNYDDIIKINSSPVDNSRFTESSIVFFHVRDLDSLYAVVNWKGFTWNSYNYFYKAYYIGGLNDKSKLDKFLRAYDKYGYESMNDEDNNINSTISVAAINHNKSVYSYLKNKLPDNIFSSNDFNKGLFVKLNNFFIRIYARESGTLITQPHADINNNINIDNLENDLSTILLKRSGTHRLLGNIDNLDNVLEIVKEMIARFGADHERKIEDNISFETIKEFEGYFRREFLPKPKFNISDKLTTDQIKKLSFKLKKLKNLPSYISKIELRSDWKDLKGYIRIEKTYSDPKRGYKGKSDKIVSVDTQGNILYNTHGRLKHNFISLGNYNTLTYIRYLRDDDDYDNDLYVKPNVIKPANDFINKYYSDYVLDVPQTKRKINYDKFLHIIDNYSLKLQFFGGKTIWITMIEGYNRSGKRSSSIKSSPSFYICTIDDLDYLKKFLDNIIKHFKK